MQHVTDIIREQPREDEFIQSHEAEILKYYISRSSSANKKKPSRRIGSGNRPYNRRKRSSRLKPMNWLGVRVSATSN
jgi:hypothetical protein